MRGAKLYDVEKAWSSIIHSIFSCLHGTLLPAFSLQERKNRKRGQLTATVSVQLNRTTHGADRNNTGANGNRDGANGNRDGANGNRDGANGNRDGANGNRDGANGNRDGAGNR